ncbi:MAG: hypothetical protein WAS72_11775 [Saprospiraceae bacterium]
MKNIAVGIAFMLIYQCSSKDNFQTISCIDDYHINLDSLAGVVYIGCGEAIVNGDKTEILPLLLHNAHKNTYTFVGHSCQNGRIALTIVAEFEIKGTIDKVFYTKEFIRGFCAVRKEGDYLKEKIYDKIQNCNISYKVSKQSIVDINMDLTFMNKKDSTVIKVENVVAHTRTTSKEELRKIEFYSRYYYRYGI